MELDKEKALAKEKEKALAIAKEKEKASAEEKENALAKEKSFAKEKQKSLTRQKQEARPLQTIVLKDISVKGDIPPAYMGCKICHPCMHSGSHLISAYSLRKGFSSTLENFLSYLLLLSLPLLLSMEPNPLS